MDPLLRRGRTSATRTAGLAIGLAVAVAVAGCSSGGVAEDGGTGAPAVDDSGESPASGSTSPTDADPTPAGPSDGGPTVTPTDGGRDTPTPAPTLAPLEGLTLETLAVELTQPVHATALPGTDRVVVVERAGRIMIVDPDDGLLGEPFLDIRDRVNAANSIEQGLLSVAFHPDWEDTGRLFVFHTVTGNDNQLVEYRADPATGQVDPGSATVLLTIDKEPDKVRHNGGQVAFGPDGLLYLSVGDGARASVNGQDPSTLLGAILRLDVDGGDPYAIPPDNPFADGADGAPEVWAYGLRNPWRFDIDPVERRIWIGNVGQETVEEINVVPLDDGGHNFGWPILEGDGEFYGGEPATELTPPVVALDHEQTPACSLTGGVVYRGPAIPELDGTYLFADWCLGWIRSVTFTDGQVGEVTDRSDQLPAEMVSSFGRDGDGEVLVVDYGAGTLSRIVPVR